MLIVSYYGNQSRSLQSIDHKTQKDIENNILLESNNKDGMLKQVWHQGKLLWMVRKRQCCENQKE